MRKIIFWIVNIIIFLLLFILSYNNLESVTLQFINMTWEMPLIILILIVFALGCFVGGFALLPLLLKQRRKCKKAAQQAKEVGTDLIKAS